MGKKIFEPLKINGMTLKNRIGLAPLLNMPGLWEKFTLTDEAIKWFEARAKGGAGLVMTGAFGPLFLDNPAIFDQFAKLADTMHSYDAKIGVQIGEGGILGGIGPSPMPYPNESDPKQSQIEIIHGQISFFPGIETVTALSAEMIEGYMDKLAGYAKALKDAGIDCVELHCAHGGATLYCSFISPYYNRREDEYGGSWENRLRFPTGTIKKMREAVGPDFPLFARISADELLGEKGITLEASQKYIVPALEEAGVDCIDVSQGSILHSPEGIQIPLYYPRGCYIHNAEAVKQATNLPVIGVGRIVDLDMAEEFLQQGKADLIYMGRQLTSDPETPNKYLDGKAEEIRKCIGCLEGCGTPCPINYDIAPDSMPLTPAEKKKKILVIGGGVAGMEVARVCAMKGHDVTLMEKNVALGGTVASLALDPLHAEFGNFIEYLATQMEKLNIDVRLNTEARETDIAGLNPDAVIMATGASLKIPDIAQGKPGVMDHIEALENRDKIGKRVVIWGLMYGAELALSLAEEGKEVTLIGEAGEKTMTSHSSDIRKYWVWRKLTDINAAREVPEAQRVDNPQVKLNVKVKTITGEGVEIEDKDGNKSTLSYETLIISRGCEKNDSLFVQIEGKAAEVYKIGDCAAAGNIQKAVWSANEVARKI